MNPKVSVITWCYSRQEMLDITLPKWLNQEGVDYEVLVGCGPIIDVKRDPKIREVFTPSLKMCQSYNKIVKEAKGEVLLITQCDMEVNSPTQLKRMLDMWHPNAVVTEKFFKDGKRDCGLYCQFMMVSKEAYEKVGGFCELFDNPESCAHEDGDLMASLLESGMNLYMMETPKEEGVYHLDHPRPDYQNDPILVKRIKKGKEIYDSRHKSGVIGLYASQIVRNLKMRYV